MEITTSAQDTGQTAFKMADFDDDGLDLPGKLEDLYYQHLAALKRGDKEAVEAVERETAAIVRKHYPRQADMGMLSDRMDPGKVDINMLSDMEDPMMMAICRAFSHPADPAPLEEPRPRTPSPAPPKKDWAPLPAESAQVGPVSLSAIMKQEEKKVVPKVDTAKKPAPKTWVGVVKGKPAGDA